MTFITVVLPVFATIFLGLVVRRKELIEPPAFKGLTDIVIYIMLPALLFGTMIRGPAFEAFGVATAYFAACLLIFAVGMIAALLLGRPFSHAALLGLNSSYGNTVMMGVPIAVAALGTDSLPPLLAIIALHSAILLPLASILVEVGTADGQRPLTILRNTLRGTLRNPIILAILSAGLWRALGIPIPAALDAWLKMLAAAASPLALLCIGATLPPLNIRAINADVAIATALKLAAFPLLVWLIGRHMGIPPRGLAVAVLTAGMPTGANAFLLARRSEHLLETSAATVLVATSLSIVSLYLVLHMVG